MAAAAPTRLSRRVVALLAVTAGATVANLYYIQPLLNLVGVVGSLVSATVSEASGWGASCGVGAAIALTALGVWTATRRRTAIG